MTTSAQPLIIRRRRVYAYVYSRSTILIASQPFFKTRFVYHGKFHVYTSSYFYDIDSIQLALDDTFVLLD